MCLIKEGDDIGFIIEMWFILEDVKLCLRQIGLYISKMNIKYRVEDFYLNRVFSGYRSVGSSLLKYNQLFSFGLFGKDDSGMCNGFWIERKERFMDKEIIIM